MGSARKLQSEIDRTLKKVQEGVELFDQIWQKVYDTENLNQKEKYEADLKKEIKKLQRYRDQIKTWAASNDIKDKRQLLDARKQIEREMERFKVCEKETKTKAFSKEGLNQAMKMDPKEKAKQEMRDWLTNTVETLSTQVDEFDYEMDGIQSNMKKKEKTPPRLTHLEESVSRHKEHVRRLEQMLRLLDNETITPENVGDVKDMVEDYLERNQDDFDEFSDPDELYDELLEQLDAATSLDPVVAVAPVVESKKDKGDKKDKDKEREKERVAAEKEAERQRERDRATAAALKSQVRGAPPVAPAPTPVQRSTSLDDQEDKRSAAARVVAAAAAAQAPQAAAPMTRPESASGSVLAAQNPPQSAPPSIPPLGTTPLGIPPQPRPTTPAAAVPQQGPIPVSGATGQQAATSVPADMMANRMYQGQGVSQGMGQTRPAQQPNWMAFPGGEAGGSFPQLQPGQEGRGANQPTIPPDQKKRFLSRLQQVHANIVDPATGQMEGQEERGAKGKGMEGLPNGLNAPEAGKPAPDMSESTGGGGGGSSMMGGGPPLNFGNTNANMQLLQACAARSIPQMGDSAWSTQGSRVRVPLGLSVPPSYPTTKMPMLENPATFEKLDSEALFFAFYHQPGTYQQYLAARELKRQSWRYHKVHGAWFQRHEEPTTITDDFEQGTYVYFDYNIMHDDLQSGWCYRLKQDFTFEYDALEDELVI